MPLTPGWHTSRPAVYLLGLVQTEEAGQEAVASGQLKELCVKTLEAESSAICGRKRLHATRLK